MPTACWHVSLRSRKKRPRYDAALFLAGKHDNRADIGSADSAQFAIDRRQTTLLRNQCREPNAQLWPGRTLDDYAPDECGFPALTPQLVALATEV